MARPEDVPTARGLRKSLDRANHWLRQHGIEAAVRVVEAGEVYRRILAETGPDDLVAVSTHGHNRVALWLFGSCAEGLIKGAKTPVLVRNTREAG
jgi:nucleotide-binding universal stress UspA family protein